MHAFQVSEDDISHVLSQYDLDSSDLLIDQVRAMLDADKIESAALDADLSSANDDSEQELYLQTQAVHENIAVQLVRLGMLNLADVRRVGNKAVLAELEGHAPSATEELEEAV